MKIIDKDFETTVPLSNIEVGNVFKYGELYYIKVILGKSSCVELSEGIWRNLPANLPVLAVEAELVIKG